MARHPRRQQLAAWLDGHDSSLDEHLATCERCASTLDEISNERPLSAVPDLKPALLTLLKPPDDLHERMSVRIAQRLQRRQDLELIGSLLGVPRETGQVFLDTGTAPVRPRREETSGPTALSESPDDHGA